MIDEKKISKLEELARLIRIDILKMLNNAGSGHTGGSLSAVEILVSLYFSKMRYDPKNPRWEERDRFILSKGHGAPALYAVLARAGYFPISELKTLRQLGSILQGHPDMLKTPGIEISTGSLGHGLSVANGVALAGKINKKDYRVYVFMGDGECEEGQIWESAMSSFKFKLDNLCGIIDNNHFQIDGSVENIKNIEPIDIKFKAFGWNVINIHGHTFRDILKALDHAEKTKGKPTVIIADTVKGKGVSIFEKNPLKYHGRVPSDEDLKIALSELNGNGY